ncbi:hypothetical protein IQ270_28810 [Microcoleus sp. LEGE 07076]|uniref:hypothetical protein n=1 Tax=Microcoleus sp. LEGE 07076 TaxID=915322 RepID=UPI001881A0E1|nr:hypothetical protein [Microcoleus sp. LEGE 07076]MBE9188528.1 hypothetical protein [Microcoleus sp. LEGE 07076]
MKDVTIPGLILGKWRVQFPDGSTLRQGLGATLPHQPTAVGNINSGCTFVDVDVECWLLAVEC